MLRLGEGPRKLRLAGRQPAIDGQADTRYGGRQRTRQEGDGIGDILGIDDALQRIPAPRLLEHIRIGGGARFPGLRLPVA